MNVRCFLPLVILGALVAGEALALEGSWKAQKIEGPQVQMKMNYPRNSSTSTPMNIADFKGLSATVMRGADPAAFRLEREAGAIQYEGEWSDGKGKGEFVFTPSQTFRAKIEGLGVRGARGLDERELFQFALFNVTSSLISELRSFGYDNIDADDLMAVAIHRVTPEFIRDLRALGYQDIPLDQLTAMRIHGITTQYARDMVLDDRRPTSEELIALKIHGVQPEFMADLRGSRNRKLSFEDLVSLKIHGVTSRYVRELEELGYEDIDAEDIVSLRIHGVTADFIRALRDAEYSKIPPAKLVEMKIHGVDSEYVKALKKK